MTDSDSTQPIQLDLDSVLKSRLPAHYRYIPSFVIKRLAKLICQEEMNELLRNNAGCRGADFCHGVLRDLNISYEIVGRENLPADGRALFISNHPLGGLDGIILIDMIARAYGKSLSFIVNDLLMAIEPLRDVFLPINKHGSQSKQASAAIDHAFEGTDPIVIFPAGLCSRKQKGEIADLKWQKSFVNKAIKFQRPVVPMFFEGVNSKGFYRFAHWRQKSGLKFNIEMTLLPREVFRKRDARFRVIVGKPIAYTALAGGKNAQSTADSLKTHVYSLDSRR